MALGDKYAPLYFPPRLNYSLESLKEHNEQYHDFLITVLEDLAASELGIDGGLSTTHLEYSNYMLKTGLVVPRFEEGEEYIAVYFEIWSMLKGKYVHKDDLGSLEADVVDYFFTRMFHVN